MSLLNQNQKISAKAITRTQQIAAHIGAANGAINGIVSDFLALDDETLTTWLNAQGAAEIVALFSAHAELGATLNTAADKAETVLAESGIEGPTTRGDVRPFADKLAEVGRVLEVNENTGEMTVSTLPEEDGDL